MKLTTQQRISMAGKSINAAIRGRFDLAFSGIHAAATGQWEGWERDRRRNRPQTRLVAQDTDLDFGTRESLISESRNLVQTFPVARKIRNQYARHCVGSCRLKWHTDNDKYNKAAADYWMNWMNMADVNGVHDFVKLTQIAVGSSFVDGDHFGQIVKNGALVQIRGIEADRVTNARGGMFNFDEPGIVGGVLMSPSGKPKAYRVAERTGYGNFKNPIDIPAQEMAHLFFANRADQTRGLSVFHTVQNKSRDLKETTDAEGLKAKKGSKTSLLIKNYQGGVSTTGPGGNAFPSDDDVPSGAGELTSKAINSVTDLYMFPGEDIKTHESNSPSQGWLYLMEWMVREIATGVDLPFSIVWNMAGLGGPGARFDIGQADRVFSEVIREVQMKWIRKIAGVVIAHAMEVGALQRHPEWFKFTVPRPAYLTIDLGRDSKASIEEIRAGLYSATQFSEESDDDYEIVVDNLGREAAMRRDSAIKWKVDEEQIRMLTPNGNPVNEQEKKAA